MISTGHIELKHLHDAPYRDTWRASDNAKPQAAQALFDNLVALVTAGGTLIINVAIIVGSTYAILDGHLAVDVYRHLGREQVSVVIHSDITTLEQARASYIAFNYLRSSGWLRDCIKTRETLVAAGIALAGPRMADADLTRDLIARDDTRWKEFTFLGTEEADPMNTMFGSVGTEG